MRFCQGIVNFTARFTENIKKIIYICGTFTDA